MSLSVDSLCLNGTWTLEQSGSSTSYPAEVPGCIHTDLARAGIIPPLDWRDNEAQQQWMDSETWIYRRDFELTSKNLEASTAELVCEGLDTLATLRLNGMIILEADNMFRTWRSSVQKHLRRGSNTLEITFHPTLAQIAEGQKKRPLREWNIYFDRHQGRGYVRKMACSYGWDWGPVAATAGIWKNIRLEFVHSARWQEVQVLQRHESGRVTLDVSWKTEGKGTVRLELKRKGQTVAETLANSSDGHAALNLEKPELWWPTGQGEQPLYDFCAYLSGTGDQQDLWSCRLGLRSLRLVREADAGGESFVFEINETPVFCKGANWVPHRILLPEITRADYARLLQDTAESNMNMLRVWGGGIYESEDFYDLCDELGILVWQDFPFACGMYPGWDKGFLASVEAEARDNIKRLRHRASLALWCGNNELEGPFAPKPDYTWEEYGALFDRLLPALCTELDPQHPYWPSSPHTPVGDRANSGDQRSGDVHLWSVFFGHESFESQRQWNCRFMSEYGFQSFPELRTLESYTAPEDRALTSYISDYHQRSEMGNRTIFSYLLDWFQPPADLENTLIVTQLTQALCVRYAAEHLRRLQPHCSGVLFWQINDIWPCASWSSIDSFGRWKSLQYDAKRFFSPVLASIEENLLTKKARLHLSNQLPQEAELEFRWQITNTDGLVLQEGRSLEKMSPQSGRFISEVDATPFLKDHHAHDLMVWVEASRNGMVLSRNWAPFGRPKHLSLADPALKADVLSTPEGTEIHVSCHKPAIYVRLSLKKEDALFDDNFFHLRPGEIRVIKLLRGPASNVVREQIRINSLADAMPVRAAASRLEARPAGYDLQRKR